MLERRFPSQDVRTCPDPAAWLLLRCRPLARARGDLLHPYTHAGGLVVRRDGAAVRLLLVRSRDGRHWVLPKGHIDPGETAEAAALREVREEAGVRGRITGQLGVDSYALPHEEVRALYFLMDFVETLPAQEDRALCWVAAAEAVGQIEIPSLRALVEEALDRLDGPA